MALELKFGHYAAETHPGHKATLMFAEAVQKRTNGAITVKIYPANALGSPPEVLEQNKLGAIDMSLPTQGALDKYVREFSAVMMPFVYDDYEHCWCVLDGPFMDWVAPKLEAQNLVFLSNNALKQGVVDGQENPLAVIYHFKIYEVQKNLALTRHVYNSMVHVMSKKTYEKLTPEQQKIIKEESKRAGQWFRDRMQEEEGELIQKLKDKGMNVTQPDVAKFGSKYSALIKQIQAVK
jgi:TRAP-type C4-dicarboxylate transport system substrate-binding protein